MKMSGDKRILTLPEETIDSYILVFDTAAHNGVSWLSIDEYERMVIKQELEVIEYERKEARRNDA